MAVKKTSYYKVNVINNVNRDMQQNGYKNIIDTIVNQYLDENGNYLPIILNEGEIVAAQRIDRVTMDIISNDSFFLFSRISKSKDNKESLIRNVNTNEIEEVLSPQELAYKTLEAYTYILLDYSRGVLCFVEGQQAPNVSLLKKLVSNHSEFYELEIQNIASQETVGALLKPGAVVNKINYDFRVPTPEILRGLGLPERAIDVLTDTDLAIAKLIIRNEPRKNLTGDNGVINRLITELRPANNEDNKVTIVGKTPSSLSQEYGYELKNYTTTIDIPTTKVVDGDIESLSLKDLADEYFNRMRSAYIGCVDIIENLANI